MALTSDQITHQRALLAGIKAAFNDAVVPIAGLLTTLRNDQPNPVLADLIAAWEGLMPTLNSTTPAIRVAIDATNAMVPSDTTAPLFAPDMSSDAAIQAVFAHANAFYNPGPSLPTVDNPTVWIGGMLQVPIVPGLNSGPGIGGTGCSWHWWMPPEVMAMPELWCEYDFYIDPDVLIGFNEEGCKLPGLGGAWEQSGQWAEASGSYGWFSTRLWHRRPDGAGNMEFAAYVYSARQQDANLPYGELIATGKMLRAGVKYKLGEHIKLNSQDASGKWLSDGVFEILLDGVVVFSDTAFKMRADPRATFQDFFVNIFHGGSQPVTAPIHYRIGGIVVDNKPIPRAPVIDMGRVPAWRKGLSVGAWSTIPLDWPAVWPGVWDGDYSGFGNDRVNSMLWKAAGTGHAVSDDNPVWNCNLLADRLAWALVKAGDGASTNGRLLDANGNPVSHVGYWPSGNPVGCHLYYHEIVVQIKGKPIVVRVFNAAGDFMSDAPPRTDAYYPDLNAWAPNGAGWDAPLTEYVESCVALDARTGIAYTSNQNGQWAMLDCNTGKWTRLPDRFPAPSWSGSVIVPRTNEHLFTRDDGTIEGRNIDTGIFTVRGHGARARCMLIQERNDTVYMVGYDSTFYRFNLLTGALDNLGATPQPVTIYNRMDDFPALGGIMHMPQYGQPARFYATE